MADPAARNPSHFTIFKTAAEEAAESESRGAWENEGGAGPGRSRGGTGNERPFALPGRTEDGRVVCLCSALRQLGCRCGEGGDVPAGKIQESGSACQTSGRNPW